jgi:hypothetical protein
METTSALLLMPTPSVVQEDPRSAADPKVLYDGRVELEYSAMSGGETAIGPYSTHTSRLR